MKNKVHTAFHAKAETKAGVAHLLVSKCDFAPLISTVVLILSLALFVKRAQVIDLYHEQENWEPRLEEGAFGSPAIHYEGSRFGVQNSLRGGPSRPNRLLVFDAWERMINVQGSLKRLVQLGVDAGFTVVEPFVYESQISKSYASPEQFEEKGLRPQTASWYFDTKELYNTKHFMSFDEHASETRRMGHVFVDAALHFDWDNKTGGTEGFYWCDSILRDLYNLQRENSSNPRSGWMFSTNLTIGRALCISPMETKSPNTFTALYFDRMFATVAKDLVHQQRTYSIALLNYRKHVFSGYVSVAGEMPFTQGNPPMRVGDGPHKLAVSFREKHFRGRPYVAFQLRTGKAWNLSGKKPEVFISWLNSCIDKSLIAIKMSSAELGMNSGLYIASDMYNNGWKGGEKCPDLVCSAISAARRRLERELSPDVFVPEEFNITQDVMGIASAVDAAMSVAANRFVFALPSNMGKWVQEQRRVQYIQAATMINCNIFESE